MAASSEPPSPPGGVGAVPGERTGPDRGPVVRAPAGPRVDLGFLDDLVAHRDRTRTRRATMALGVSVGVTVVWAAAVTVTGQWGRVAGGWEAALTMVFGSFVAGSTPQGGGAVAFPVFTKVLEVPSEVARTFSLCIQTVGMGAATATILITRRRIAWRALPVSVGGAAVGFLVGITVLADPSDPFRPPVIPGAYVKVTFTLVVVGMAFIVLLTTRVPLREVRTDLPPMDARRWVLLASAAGVGGFAASLTGSGADVIVYLTLALLFTVDPRVGVPTSVVVMAAVSVLGFVTLGLLDGQLATTVADGRVVAVGGTPVDLDAGRFDLFGMWLAAVPVVAWGAPVGSWVASRVSARSLVVFVAVLAAAEAVSTMVFLTELRTDAALAAYGAAGLVVVPGALWLAARHRHRITGLPGVDLSRPLVRGGLDVAPDYREALETTEGDR